MVESLSRSWIRHEKTRSGRASLIETTEGVSAAWMGSSSGGPEPGGTARGGMLGCVEEGIFLSPCPDKSMAGLRNKGSLVIQPLREIDIYSGKWMNLSNGDTSLTICICWKIREGERRERQKEKKERTMKCFC